MEINVQTRQAYSEIDEFLSLLDEKTRNEVPNKLREFFNREKDKDYHKGINPNISIKEQNLKKETLALIALLNLQYWCKDEKEKERLKNVYAENEKKYQEKLSEKCKPENIFKKKENNTIKNSTNTKENVQLIKYKEPILKKVLNGILKFFHIK